MNVYQPDFVSLVFTLNHALLIIKRKRREKNSHFIIVRNSDTKRDIKFVV